MIIIMYRYVSGQFITTSAEVTRNCGLVRESQKNGLKSGQGFIMNCPDMYVYINVYVLGGDLKGSCGWDCKR